MPRISKKDEDFTVASKGWKKLLHKTIMLILFPLRKPWWFLLILIILFLAPTFRGVKPAEVHLWYWHYFQNLSSNASTKINNKAQKLIPAIENIEKVSKEIIPETAKTKSQVSQNNTIKQSDTNKKPTLEVRRKMFEVASSQSTNTIKAKSKTKKNNPTPKLNLNYLDVPQNISGKAQIINANEIEIDGQILFLYGIFVKPASNKGVDADLYLRQLIENKLVNCQIIAYTHQDIATAICYFDGININHRLVELGYSQNIALN